MAKNYSVLYLQVISLLILLGTLSSSFAQIDDNNTPVYCKSKWKLVENDSVTIIKNSISNKLDTVFFNEDESDPDDSSAAGN